MTAKSMPELRTLTAEEYRQKVWAQMTEEQFQRLVVGQAHAAGWLVYHPYNSRKSVPGFPDLTMVHPRHGLLFLELKTMKGRVRPEQAQWREAIRAAGVRSYIVRPSDEQMITGLLTGEREN